MSLVLWSYLVQLHQLVRRQGWAVRNEVSDVLSIKPNYLLSLRKDI